MVDDSYVAKMNGVVVGSGGLGTVYTHEVPLNLLLGCDSSSYSENLLVMNVYNNPGYGALLYQLVIEYVQIVSASILTLVTVHLSNSSD